MRGKIRLIITLLFIILTGTVIADEITIFGTEYKPPKILLVEGEPYGILVDIMAYAQDKMGVTFNLTLYPWKRSYTQSLSGAGGIIGLSKNEERLSLFDYSDVMYYDDLLLVVRKENFFEYNSLDDLKGKIVGARRGSSYGDDFELGKREYFKVREDNGGIPRLKLLLHGRIDVAIVGAGLAGYNTIIEADEILRDRSDEFVIIENPFKRDPNYLGFPKEMNMGAFLEEFNLILQEMNENGEIDRIISSHKSRPPNE